MSKISTLHARQILDSRGNPTVEVDVTLQDGSFGRAAVPSGASVGEHEVLELRDKAAAYGGKGTLLAVDHANTELFEAIKDIDAFDQASIDGTLISTDGTKDLHREGANAILGVSLAVSKAAAASAHIAYYAYIHDLFQKKIGKHFAPKIPRPMFNILNGGAHTDWQTTDIQEFMVVPLSAPTFAESLRWGDEIYQSLKKILEEKGYQTTVGDEGGFAPNLDNEEALKFIMEAIVKAGYQPGRDKDFAIALDCASSELFDEGQKKGYKFWKSNPDKLFSSDDMINLFSGWCDKYPIISIEDGMSEQDWDGWKLLNDRLGAKIQLVGDDLFVTNTRILKEGIQKKVANSILIKINQIGTLTETFAAIEMAKRAGWTSVISHRSGETEDTTIADIAVGTNAGQIKTGSLSRSDRTAKYNQLLRIEASTMSVAAYPGRSAFRQLG